jgi:hypothetical protein
MGIAMETATRMRSLPPGLALAGLAALALSIVALWTIGWRMPMIPDGAPSRGDLDFYADVVARLRAGAPYYTALHDQLVADDYGMRSVFNWRPPFFLSMLAVLPSPAVAHGLLCALVVGAGAFCVRFVGGQAGRGGAVAAAVLLALGLAACLAPNAALMCELYAGALILLSVCAYGLKLPWLGFVAGALALLMRELAAPYVIISAVLAWRDGRRREGFAWGAVILAYGAYFLWHAGNVLPLIGPEAPAGEGWLQFGGATFVLLTAVFDGVMLLLPYWVMGLLLPLAVLGLIAWPGGARDRMLLTVLSFVVLFSFAGRPENSYWGALYTPLLVPGLVMAPAALRDLVWALGRRPQAA